MSTWNDTCIDWTALSNQTLGTDANNFSITGISNLLFDKVNSSSEHAATAIVNGTGLVFQPASGAYYLNVNTMSELLIHPTSVYAGIDPSTPIEMWTHHVSDAGCNNDTQAIHMGIADDGGGSYPAYESFMIRRGHMGGTTNLQGVVNRYPSTSDISFGNGSSWFGAYNVTRLVLPLGLAGSIIQFYAGAWSGDWPTADQTVMFASWRPTFGMDGFEQDGMYNGPHFVIGATAGQAGPGYTGVIGHTKIKLFY